MALNKTDLGKKISDALQAANGNSGGMSAPEKASMQAKWEIVADEMIKYFKTNMDIKLIAGDIPVAPGTFKDSLSAPITGSGASTAITLSGKIE